MTVQVRPLVDVYLFEAPSRLSRRSNVVARGKVDLTSNLGEGVAMESLERDPHVGFVMKQVPLQREPRGYAPPSDPEWTNQWTLVSQCIHLTELKTQYSDSSITLQSDLNAYLGWSQCPHQRHWLHLNPTSK